ncbi:MAG: hypothetical protein ACRCW9_09850 [Cetobacterium sp.]
MIYKLKYKEKYLSSVDPIKFSKTGIVFANMKELKKFISQNDYTLSEYTNKLEAIGFDAITLIKYSTLLKEINQIKRS